MRFITNLFHPSILCLPSRICIIRHGVMPILPIYLPCEKGWNVPMGNTSSCRIIRSSRISISIATVLMPYCPVFKHPDYRQKKFRMEGW